MQCGIRVTKGRACVAAAGDSAAAGGYNRGAMTAPAPIQKLPAIRIEAGAGSISPENMLGDNHTIMIGFVLEVSQGYHGDLMNLWNALRKCINVHHDDWLASDLLGFPNLSYRSMSWQQAAITYNPIYDTRALISTAVLSVSLAIREC